jgi:hypothetical protein
MNKNESSMIEMRKAEKPGCPVSLSGQDVSICSVRALISARGNHELHRQLPSRLRAAGWTVGPAVASLHVCTVGVDFPPFQRHCSFSDLFKFSSFTYFPPFQPFFEFNECQPGCAARNNEFRSFRPFEQAAILLRGRRLHLVQYTEFFKIFTLLVSICF